MTTIANLMPTIIERTPVSQLRVSVETFKGKTSLDLREWRIYGGNTEFGPTKHGIKVPPELLDTFLEAINKQRKNLPVRVTDVPVDVEETAYVVGKLAQDAVFNKRHVYRDLETAQSKTPPSGYKLFKVLIKGGAVLQHRLLMERVGDEWRSVRKDTEAAPATEPRVVRAKPRSVPAPIRRHAAPTHAARR